MTEPIPSPLLELSDVDWWPYEVDLRLSDRWTPRGEVEAWWSDWTGADGESAPDLAIFGRDGAGGVVAFWRRDARPLVEQPVVFFGSEGELGVVSANLRGFLALLAHGVEPQILARDPVQRARGETPHPEAGEPVAAALNAWFAAGGEGAPPEPGAIAAEAIGFLPELEALVARATVGAECVPAGSA